MAAVLPAGVDCNARNRSDAVFPLGEQNAVRAGNRSPPAVHWLPKYNSFTDRRLAFFKDLQPPGISDLGEDRAVRLGQAVVASAAVLDVAAVAVIVRIAEEEHGLGIDFV